MEREKLIARVERNVLSGLDTPGALFAEMPELGSAGTARSYLRAVLARWEELGRTDTLEKARHALIGNTIRMREAAWKNVQECESATARAQFLRLVDKAIEREEKLRGLAAAKTEAGTRDGGPGGSWEEITDEELDRELSRLERELGLDCTDGRGETVPSGTA